MAPRWAAAGAAAACAAAPLPSAAAPIPVAGAAQRVGSVDFDTGHVRIDDDALVDLRTAQRSVAVVASYGVHYSGASATLNAVAQTDSAALLTGFPVARGERAVPELWLRKTSAVTAGGAEVWLLSCEGCNGGPAWAAARAAGAQGLPELQARLFHVMKAASSHLVIHGSINDLSIDLVRLLLRRSSHIAVKVAAEGGDAMGADAAPMLPPPTDSVRWVAAKSELTDEEAAARFAELASDMGAGGGLPSVAVHAVPPATADWELQGDLSRATLARLDADYAAAVARLRDGLRDAAAVGTGAFAASLLGVVVGQTNGKGAELPQLPRLEELLLSALLNDTAESALVAYRGFLDRAIAGDEKTIKLVGGEGLRQLDTGRERHHGVLLPAGGTAPAPAAQAELDRIEQELQAFVKRHWDIALSGFAESAERAEAWRRLERRMGDALEQRRKAYRAASETYIDGVYAELEKDVRARFEALPHPCDPQAVGRVRDEAADAMDAHVAALKRWWSGRSPVAEKVAGAERRAADLVSAELAGHNKGTAARLASAADAAREKAGGLFAAACRAGEMDPLPPRRLADACAAAERDALAAFDAGAGAALQRDHAACAGDGEWHTRSGPVPKARSVLRGALSGVAAAQRERNDGMISEGCRAKAGDLVNRFNDGMQKLIDRCKGDTAPTETEIDEAADARAKATADELGAKWGAWEGAAFDACAQGMRGDLRAASEHVKQACEEKLFGVSEVMQWRQDVFERARDGLPGCWKCGLHSALVRSYLKGELERSIPPVPPGRFRDRCISRSLDHLLTKDVFRDAATYEEAVHIGLATACIIAIAVVAKLAMGGGAAE